MKKWCQVIRSAAPVTQNHLSEPEDLRLQNATPLRKSAPSPPNISDEHVFCTAPATRNASLKILFKCPTPASIFGHATKPSRFARFREGAQSLAPATRKHIWTSKSAPYPSVFCTFDLDICFAPQRRALFRHLNFQKWSEAGVFWHFHFEMCLHATTACTFSTFQVPKVARTPSVFNILTWKYATTACNFSSLLWPAGSAPAALASLLFDPPEPQIIGKTQWILPFRASPSSCFLLFLFHSSLFWSFSSLCLCPALLFTCPYCRKFDF